MSTIGIEGQLFPNYTPMFVEPISHAWSVRKLMALPEHIQISEHSKKVSSEIRKLVNFDFGELASTVEDDRFPLEQRLAAGQILGLCEDPRINVFEPKMIDIEPPEFVEIGISYIEAEQLYLRNRNLAISRSWIEKECPQHRISLQRYRMAKYPITNFEYSVFLQETNEIELPTSWFLGRYPSDKSNHPVHTVSAEMAEKYAVWLSNKTGRQFRLPSEAEWEFSCAGPEKLQFPWGNEFLPARCNTCELGLWDSTPIGAFPSGNSFFGISDMAGNVEEYVQESYSPYLGGKVIEDDLYLCDKNYRVARGGSYTRFQDLARSTRRHGWNPDSPIYMMGFRLAEGVQNDV